MDNVIKMRYRDETGKILEISSNNKKVVLILGAGATYADRAGFKKMEDRPPLDKGFFKQIGVNRIDDNRAFAVDDYLEENYGINIFDPDSDSLEKTMVILYTDIFNKKLQKKAYKAFQDLLSLFIARLAETTNNIRITRRSYLYLIFDYFLTQGY